MRRLELKVPPDAVAIVVGVAMWIVSKRTPSFALPGPAHVVVGALLFIAGWALIVAARTGFSAAATTFNPMAPERSAALVTTGVYRFTRNPMYLGTLLAGSR